MFSKIFIVESDTDWAEILKKLLAATNRIDDIVHIDKIDEAYQKIKEKEDNNSLVFVDIFWNGSSEAGLRLAESLKDFFPTMKLVAFTTFKLSGSLREKILSLFDAVVYKNSTSHYPGTIQLKDVNLDFLRSLKNNQFHATAKNNELNGSDMGTHDLKTQYYFETKKTVKVSSQFVATDFYKFSQLEEDLQLNRFIELHSCIKEVLRQNKYSSNELVVLFTGDGVIIGILNESVNPVALHISLELIEHLRLTNISQDIRIGVHEGITYHLLGTKGESQLVGPGVNMAARLEAASEPGRILVSENYFAKYINRRSESFTRELSYEDSSRSFKVKEDEFLGRFVWKGTKAT